MIHTSSTGILCINDVLRCSSGIPAGKVYDDWDNVDEVTSLPDEAPHRNVDKIVLAAGEAGSSVKTAIVCPPTIYGPGRGPDNTYSDQWYLMAKGVIQRGKGFRVGDGDNKWTYVHIADLSNLFLHLVEAAATGGGNATWGKKGYYFAEDGEYVWGDIAQKIAQEAHKQGLIKSADVDSLTVDQVNEVTPSYAPRWALNSRCRAIRARKLFGWTPKGDSIEKLLPSIVKEEAKKIGVIKGHAVHAAGDA